MLASHTAKKGQQVCDSDSRFPYESIVRSKSVALALALGTPFFLRVLFTLRYRMTHAEKSNAIVVNALLGIYSMSRP